VTTAVSVGLLMLVGALGDSAAVPGLGAPAAHPPWDLDAAPSSVTVTILTAAAYLTGGAAVLSGLAMVARRDLPSGRALGLAGLLAVTAMAVVPPAGSADHLSYVAYGRIAAAGDDPYAVAPLDWRHGTDPVAGAVAPPWQRTPSVYGPVATAAQAAAAVAGGGSLRLTVWSWQLLCAAAFGAVAVVVDRMTGRDQELRTRAAVLWTLNPVLLGQLVLGAHVDVLAAAFGAGALLVAFRRRLLTGPLLAGLLLGAAAGTKAPYALFGLAACWGLRTLPRRELTRAVVAGAVGALAVLIPSYLWAGPHAFDQLGRASRFTSLATPWRALANLGDLVLGPGTVNAVATPLALALAAALAALLWRHRLAPPSVSAPGPVGAQGYRRAREDAVGAALALTAAWVLVAPYALPWYDAMVWVPLALVGPPSLDRLLLARGVVLALAYAPGRAVGLSPVVESVTLGARTYVAPVLVTAVIVGVVRWTRRSGRDRHIPQLL
jgi:hypothetical protein